MPRLLATLAFVVAAAVGRAQTFIVDINNGPGTNFTSVDTAMTTVPDGATLLVKSGNYSVNTTVTGKGLTILGAPGTPPLLIGLIGFSGLNANQHVVVKGIKPGFGWPLALVFQSCQGRVHLQDCGDSFSSASLSTTQCAQVSAVRCVFNRGGLFTDSDVACSDTVFQNLMLTFADGIVITGGRTRLVRGSVTGGHAYPNGPPFYPAISMNGGDLAVLGTATLTGGGNGTAAALAGSGTVRMTAGVSRVGAAAPFTTIDEGWTTSTAAPLGGIVTGKLEGSANLFGGLVFGFPQAPATFPDIAEELWVNPIGFAATGQLGAPLTFPLDVPNDPLFSGWTFGWQGVTFGPAGASLTNPAWFCVQ